MARSAKIRYFTTKSTSGVVSVENFVENVENFLKKLVAFATPVENYVENYLYCGKTCGKLLTMWKTMWKTPIFYLNC